MRDSSRARGWTRASSFVVLLAAAGTVAARPLAAPRAVEPVVGLPCEGCEAVFDGRPDRLTAKERLAPAEQPGEAMVIEGAVRDAAGKPVEGVIVYAYHTDARGVYPRDASAETEAGRRHGTLRAWVRTDGEGRYTFLTIRPASYPDGRTPAHVHMHVVEPGRCTYYIDSIHFTDDPRLSPREREEAKDGRGGSGLLTPSRDPDGTWRVRRDIVLGKGVPGYPPRGPAR